MNAAELGRMHALEDQHFWFRARRQELKPWLLAALESASPGPWLDLGVGTGRNLDFFQTLSPGRKLIGIDRSAVAVAHCRGQASGADLLRSGIETLPLRDDSFGLVTALDVLEHVDDDRAVLSEVHRCLKGGGEFIATVPQHPLLYSRHDRALGHRRRYRRSKLHESFTKTGFEILDCRSFNTLLLPAVGLWRGLGSFTREEAEPRSDVRQIPQFLNALLGTILRVESSLPRRLTDFSGLSWWIRSRRRT